MKVIIAGVLVILLALGWFSYFSDNAKDNGLGAEEIADMKTQADEWVDEGLYQRAAEKYNEILAVAESEEIRAALVEARRKRYIEEPASVMAYRNDLEAAVSLYPSNTDFISSLLDIYDTQGNALEAYNLICSAEKAGVTDSTITERKNDFRYGYTLRSAAYDDFCGVSETGYSVCRGGSWDFISAGGENSYYSYSYIGPVSTDNVAVYGFTDSARLIGQNGLVMGKFPFEVAETGMFSEGLVPIKMDGLYSYYDEFAKKTEGEYEYAGAYKNGAAPVTKDGQQYLINKDGQAMTGNFYKISVDKNGVFMSNSVMVASEKKGTFALYNYETELKKLIEISADDADVYKGGFIAFSLNGKWGFFDTEGNVIIEPEYEEAKSFSNGLAAVKKNGKWGFINEENELVINYQFAGADYFNMNGLCMVKTERESSAALDSAENNEELVKEYWQLLELKLGIL